MTQLRWVVGSTATLRALLVDAKPKTGITYKWLDSSGRVISAVQYSMSNNNGSTVYEVTLPSLGENDGGTYACVVGNNISTSSQPFDVFVTGWLVIFTYT